MDFKSLLKLDKESIQESLIEHAVEDVNADIDRKRLDLESNLRDKKRALSKLKTITNIENFNSKSWINEVFEAEMAVDIAKLELKNFKKYFCSKE